MRREADRANGVRSGPFPPRRADTATELHNRKINEMKNDASDRTPIVLCNEFPGKPYSPPRRHGRAQSPFIKHTPRPIKIHVRLRRPIVYFRARIPSRIFLGPYPVSAMTSPHTLIRYRTVAVVKASANRSETTLHNIILHGVVYTTHEPGVYVRSFETRSTNTNPVSSSVKHESTTRKWKRYCYEKNVMPSN